MPFAHTMPHNLREKVRSNSDTTLPHSIRYTSDSSVYGATWSPAWACGIRVNRSRCHGDEQCQRHRNREGGQRRRAQTHSQLRYALHALLYTRYKFSITTVAAVLIAGQIQRSRIEVRLRVVLVIALFLLEHVIASLGLFS